MKPPTEKVFQAHGDRLFSIAYTVCQNREDAEDAMQDTMIRYSCAKKEFESEEHIKAWLIRVVINRAKDIRSSFWRRNQANWEEEMASLPFEEPEDSRLFQAVMNLPEKYRTVIHLFYCLPVSVTTTLPLRGLRHPGDRPASGVSRRND